MEPLELKDERLAEMLEILASPVRLALIHQLRTPRRLHELRATATGPRGDLAADRPISRQAVSQHLRALMEAQVVLRVPGSRGETEAYVLNHPRLFLLTDRMRNLVKLTPLMEPETAPERTSTRGPSRAGLSPSGPRLVEVYGQMTGRVFSLGGGTRWTLGRGRRCDIRLSHDPYASSLHAELIRASGAFYLIDRHSRNGTAVNWVALARGGEARLGPGDVVEIGRSLLVFQDPAASGGAEPRSALDPPLRSAP